MSSCPSNLPPTGTPKAWPPWRLTAGSTARRRRRRACGPCKPTPSPAGALNAVNAEFEDGTTLRGYVAAPDTLAPGGLLTVHLDWASTDAASGDVEHKVFVQLLDAAGQLVAQDDRPLVLSAPRAPAVDWRFTGWYCPPSLGAEPYQLIAGIYDPTQEGAPRLKTTVGVDHVTLRELLIVTLR